MSYVCRRQPLATIRLGQSRRPWSQTPSANGAHVTALTLALPLVVSQQLQVDGIRQCVVSQVVCVPVVSAIVECTDLGRGSGITKHAIKVERTVIFSAGADPRIDGLTLDHLLGCKDREWRSRLEEPFHGGQSAAEDSQSLRM